MAPKAFILDFFSEKSRQFSIRVLYEGEVIVDDDSGGDPKAIEVDTVDASFVLRVLFVEKELLNAKTVFSKSRTGGHKPTVSKITLSDVTRRDSISKKSGVRECLRGTSPLDRFTLSQCGCHIFG